MHGLQGRAALQPAAGVAAGALSNPVVCGILAPRPGIEPLSLPLQAGVLTTGLPGKFREFFFFFFRKITSLKLKATCLYQFVCYYKCYGVNTLGPVLGSTGLQSVSLTISYVPLQLYQTML